jgi:Nickel/cobalt transporter regulator
MNRLIATCIALTVLSAGAAEARDYGYGRGPGYFGPEPRAMWGGPGMHRWKRGDYFRPSFGPGFRRHAYINDWRRYGLRRPPVGYNWIGYDNSFLLVALATGLIADVALANSYGNYGYGYRYGY